MWQRMDTWEVGHFDIFFRAVEDQRKRVDRQRSATLGYEEEWLESTGQ